MVTAQPLPQARLTGSSCSTVDRHEDDEVGDVVEHADGRRVAELPAEESHAVDVGGNDV